MTYLVSDGDLADMKEVAQQSQMVSVRADVLLALVEEVERARVAVLHPPLEFMDGQGRRVYFDWDGTAYHPRRDQR